MKGTLHTRKAGAAQSLLGKNRRGGRLGTMGRTGTVGTGVTGVAGTGGTGASSRAQKFANSKSKMKMIDVTEVQGLNKEHQQREDQIAQEETREQRALARKRKILEDAAEKGLVAAPKIRKLEEEQRKSAKPIFGNTTTTKTGEESTSSKATENGSGSDDDEWKMILKERSNKLSDDDKERAQQFYTNNKYNPTPDQKIYKMKLHEERMTDPNTGQAMKETYYLELNYETGKTKQSKKIKRYD